MAYFKLLHGSLRIFKQRLQSKSKISEELETVDLTMVNEGFKGWAPMLY